MEQHSTKEVLCTLINLNIKVKIIFSKMEGSKMNVKKQETIINWTMLVGTLTIFMTVVICYIIAGV